MTRPLIGAAVAGLTVAAVGCGEGPSNSDLVARVGDHELTVAQVVGLLVDEERLPTQAGVVESLAELWIDYTLLAEAAAEDSTFQDLDLEPLVRQQVEQVMLFQLRDSVIQVDTFITPDELRALYQAESPDVELRARHIMLTLPFQATQAQRDSVRADLEELRGSILAGTAFAAVARASSQDPGSAPLGGDLGFFALGEMVLPFEQAALTLELGEVSDVVETPMGFHLIRVDERRVQSFDDVASAFRAEVQAERHAQAESTFVAGLESRADPQLLDGALQAARELASNPGTRLSGRAARRPLLRWDDGEYTAGELQVLLQSDPVTLREQLAQGTDEDVEGFLRDRARRDLLITQARIEDLGPPRARVDSLITAARDQLLAVTRTLGLLDLDAAPGEARELAIARTVQRALTDNLSGATQIVPLGLIGFQLREGVPIAIFESGVGESILRIGQLRVTRGASLLEESLDTLTQAPDTVNR